jgi:predicted transcriptional regulator
LSADVPCEEFVRDYLPGLRSIISRRLINQFDLSQAQVATKLGLTQAAINQYLHSLRGEKTIKEIEENPKLISAINRAAETLATNEEQHILVNQLCGLCRLIRSEIYEEPNFDPSKCRI